MFVYTDNVWGDSASWDRNVAPPGDIHLVHFATTRATPPGTGLLLEAGVRNTSWFIADDQNITMSVDLDQ